MTRTVRLALTVSAVAALAALAAHASPRAVAAERMWLGFHDDPSYRWVADRDRRAERAAADGASIVRLLVEWNRAAPRRPASPANPFDPAYVLDDVDEAVRRAQEHGQEVMLTISGTPSWANGGKPPNVMPTRLSDLTSFARAIATRYSGRYNGYPFVRFWSVWNEPNLQLFLTPQFDARGRSVAPANYARLYAAAYAGIKAGNPSALVAIGETSARGTDKPGGLRPTHSPARFAELVAKANPRLQFDAWAHHPYPSVPSLRPSQRVRWPNVSLASLPQFQQSLRTWFRRSDVRIWVTEYAHETRPEDPLGVPYATQATYLRQAVQIARSYPFVDMFIWFVYQDDQGQPWDSGLYRRNGAAKGSSAAVFRSLAAPLDARNPVISLRAGTLTPLVRLYARRYCANDPIGTPIGMTWRIFQGGRLIAVDQQTSPLLRDCTVTARLRFPGGGVRRGVTYTATFELNDRNGILVDRRLTIRGT
ncbi:MAG: glycoside hydrolase family 5 protein [Gaiellaceae bacterium]|nr:glycoside hydrolase family 5 protein [Gaiellaceae bacterium]